MTGRLDLEGCEPSQAVAPTVQHLWMFLEVKKYHTIILMDFPLHVNIAMLSIATAFVLN